VLRVLLKGWAKDGRCRKQMWTVEELGSTGTALSSCGLASETPNKVRQLVKKPVKAKK